MSIITESTAQLEVRRALVYALAHDEILSDMLARTSDGEVAVLDDVEDNQVMPYVNFGLITETPETSTQNALGRSVTVTLNIWGRTTRQEVDEVANQIIDVVERRELSNLLLWTWRFSVMEYAQTMRDPDGISYHGVLRFRISVYRTA